MDKNYKKLIKTIRDYFPTGGERIILNLNVHTKQWALCNANYGCAVDISSTFAVHLNEQLKFKVHTVHEHFICMASELVGYELRKYLQTK